MVMREGLVLALAGVALGSLLAAWATKAIGSMLFEVSARDPIAYGAAAPVLLLVAVGACWLPARFAACVEPVTALNAAG
jgi:ABC-type antimicrobial peptide transport system permease subunit